MPLTQEKKTRLVVSGVCCAAEETVMRKVMEEAAGHDGYSFNTITCELVLDGTVDERAAMKRLADAGFRAHRKQETPRELSLWDRHGHAFTIGVASLLGGVGIAVELLDGPAIVAKGMLLAGVIVGGWKIFLKAVTSVRNRTLDMNVLMSVAVVGAMCIDKWNEAAAVIVLFSVAVMLESYSTSRVRRTIASLMALSPETASVLRDSVEESVPAREVVPGAVIIVRPGERIPLDGEVMEGHSSVDQSPLTGESSPVEKSTGTPVFAGSINAYGVLRIRVTRAFEDTTLARVIHMVEEAHSQRAPIQSAVDRFASVYTPAVLGLAFVVAVVPPLLYQGEFISWLYRALVLLVIACPCALVISTPVTIVSALTNAARQGVLIKGGMHLETLSRVRAIAVDKTGTLTVGAPRVTDVVLLNTIPRERVIQLAAAIEHHSEHHVASAVLIEAERCGVPFTQIPVERFEALPGKGVKARIAGEDYYVGNHQMCEEFGYCSSRVEHALGVLARQGKTGIVLGKGNEALGIIAVADMVRGQSKSTVKRLKALGIEHVIMLSGDHEPSAQRLAEEVGIERYHAELLPEEKVAAIEELRRNYGHVAMIGDGINDAPALAAASVGIAMGASGADAALETADVVLMSNDLTRLPSLFSLSKRTVAIIKQNVAIALTLKFLFLVLGVAGVAGLWMAVLADDGAALIVIFNGLRALSLREQS